MNREIKFRAWDKQTNSWFCGGNGFALSWDATEIIDDNERVYDTNDIVFQQFTGLKDKHGKDIYEFDIIEFDLGELGKERGVVRFSKHGFWTSQSDEFHEEILSEELNDLPSEVIGNVFQNPELL